MNLLSDKELYAAITYARNLNETELLAVKQGQQTPPKKTVVQIKFADILKESIDDYASESSAGVPFIAMTQSMTLVMLSLLESLYKTKTLH
ncbi:MAG: hypothetical protein IBX55_10775 [Methyloprofundus sp.]|nr:hypothetical protein [Methyloprofundus sp.]